MKNLLQFIYLWLITLNLYKIHIDDSVNLFAFELDDILVGDIEVAELSNLLLLDALEQGFLALEGLLQLLVVDLAHFLAFFLQFLFLHDLLFQLDCVLAQQLLALVLQLCF